MKLTYLIGEPGVGKSTLLGEFTRPLRGVIVDRPFGHVVYDEIGAVELGKPRVGGFGGTDSLSMSVQPKVVDWAGLPEFPFVFGEGDRLANNKFFSSMVAIGYDVTVVWLWGSEIAATRRAQRAAQLGTKQQDDSWVQGRKTKVQNLGEEWATVVIKADRPLQEQVEILRVQPVFERLWEGRHARA